MRHRFLGHKIFLIGEQDTDRGLCRHFLDFIELRDVSNTLGSVTLAMTEKLTNQVQHLKRGPSKVGPCSLPVFTQV
jgi:hypothetical protein